MNHGTRGAIAQLDAEDFDLWQAVGGVRGLVESVAPGVVFVVVFVLTRDLAWSIGSAVGLALIAMVLRLIARSTLTQPVSGLGGILIGALWAWRTGEAQDFYAWGLFVNAGFALAVVASLLVRRPLVGLIVKGFSPGAAHAAGAQWAFRAATLLWPCAFLEGLAVAVPQYLHSEVGWLGSARVVMGLPVWAMVLSMTWSLVRHSITAAKDAVCEEPMSEE